MLYKAQHLSEWSTGTLTKDGVIIPCRPEGSKTIPAAWRRIKAALGVLIGKYDAVDWEEGRYDVYIPSVKPCAKAPEGWYCTRQDGHEGPCAARPVLGTRVKR